MQREVFKRNNDIQQEENINQVSKRRNSIEQRDKIREIAAKVYKTLFRFGESELRDQCADGSFSPYHDTNRNRVYNSQIPDEFHPQANLKREEKKRKYENTIQNESNIHFLGSIHKKVAKEIASGLIRAEETGNRDVKAAYEDAKNSYEESFNSKEIGRLGIIANKSNPVSTALLKAEMTYKLKKLLNEGNALVFRAIENALLEEPRNNQIKKLPEEIITQLVEIIQSPRNNVIDNVGSSTSSQQEEIIRNIEEILTKGDNVSNKYPKIKENIEKSRKDKNAVSGISSLSEALDNLHDLSQQVDSEKLRNALDDISAHLQESTEEKEAQWNEKLTKLKKIFLDDEEERSAARAESRVILKSKMANASGDIMQAVRRKFSWARDLPAAQETGHNIKNLREKIYDATGDEDEDRLANHTDSERYLLRKVVEGLEELIDKTTNGSVSSLYNAFKDLEIISSKT